MSVYTFPPYQDNYNKAVEHLLAPQNITVGDLEKNMKTLNSNAISYADIYFQSTLSEQWLLEDSIIKSGSFANYQGVSVRTLFGDKAALAYSNDLSLDAINQASKVAGSAARAHTAVRYPVQSAPTAKSSLYQNVSPLDSLSTQAKQHLLSHADKVARGEDRRVTSVTASLNTHWETVLVMRSDMRVVADIRPMMRFMVYVLVEEDGRRESGYSGHSGRYGLESYREEDVTADAKEAVRIALLNLNAKDAKAGEMTVVLGKGSPGILLHEAVGHGLEGDFNRKGSSAFANRMGQQVAAKGVSVVDNGTLARSRGSLNFDDEGNPSSEQVLIEDGILSGYMQDAMNASLMGASVTGNGRRESYSCLPMPRMTNTYMLPGEHDHEEIIESVKDGIYVASLGSGQVDITNGNFVFCTSEAYRIENGKVTHPVKGSTIIGSGAEALTKVSMIGNNLEIEGLGSCGKAGQTVPVGVGQPTIKMDGLVVGGTG